MIAVLVSRLVVKYKGALGKLIPLGQILNFLGRYYMNCWICGKAEADSREHRLKASDLRRQYGNISPQRPIYFHDETKRNVPIYSAKSDKLKTSKIICQRCNDTRTSKYDNAWEKLYSGIKHSWPTIQKTRRLKLQKVFPGKTKKQSIYFHLFFVKLFGCRIVDEKMPIDIREFSKCLLNEEPLKNFYLGFNLRSIKSPHGRYLGQSAVHGKEYNGKCEAASWYYSLGEFDIQITWFHTKPLRNVPYSWHPSSSGKIIKFRQR